jgi:DNA integrity scanning protein DisA with diadenylate cyclase activity
MPKKRIFITIGTGLAYEAFFKEKEDTDRRRSVRTRIESGPQSNYLKYKYVRKDLLETPCRHAGSISTLVIELAVEIAREGREGRRIGTLFTIGDGEQVLEHSRPLILDPIARHPKENAQHQEQ